MACEGSASSVDQETDEKVVLGHALTCKGIKIAYNNREHTYVKLCPRVVTQRTYIKIKILDPIQF